ncbi:MAG: alkaline phosphatase D family protein [Acidimicrobiales bacterium]|nr:alkaline phosphatase D family protein [Acidimicrobiales bacterium]
MASPFTHAVASFDPTADAVLLWTRAPGAGPLRWTVAGDADLTDVVGTGLVDPDPERDHTAVVDVSGLEPATTYFYGFSAAGQRSPVGRTRTLPAAGADHVRLGLVSCARFSVAPLGVYRAVAEREVDLVLHLGDYIYEDDGSSGPRSHEPPHPARSRSDYRRRIAQVRADPDAQALHLRHPMVAILDDHDVADNCWSTGAKHHDDASDGPFAARAAAATEARQEWLPQRLRDASDPRTTWRSVELGDLAELLLLDTRLSGRDQHAGDDGTKPLRDPTRSLLGDEQRQWMDERLADGDRPWTLLATGVVVNEVGLPAPAVPGIGHLLPNGYALVDREVLHDDQWDGYPHERAHLVEQLAARRDAGGRTVILSADIHSSWAFEGPCDDDGRAVAVEMTVPAVASAPMGRGRLPGAWRLLDAAVRRLEHVPWADVTRRGYGVVDLTRERALLEWWFVEPTDEDPGRSQWLGAAWEARRADWPPQLREVEATADPVRAARRDDLPPRPGDLARIRRNHRVRLVAERTSGVALAMGALAALAHRRR